MRNRMIAIAVAVVPAMLVLITGWALVIGPRGAERSAADDEMAVDSDELRAVQVQLGSAREFLERGDSAVDTLAQLRQSLPDSPDVGGFVTLNEEAARNSGVEILSLVPEQPEAAADEGFVLEDDASDIDSEAAEPALGDEVSSFESVEDGSASSGSTELPEGVDAVHVAVSARGPDSQVPAYIASLSNMSRLVLIDEVSTVADGDGNTSATLRLSVLYRQG